MVGIPVTTVCYVLANIGYLGVMSKTEIIMSHAVAVVSRNIERAKHFSKNYMDVKTIRANIISISKTSIMTKLYTRENTMIKCNINQT